MRDLCPECDKLPWAKGARRRCICVGMNLDVGSSDHPQKGFLGMDRRELPGVSFIWDVASPGAPPWWAQQQFGAKAMPLPFPDQCVDKLLMSHLFEHLPPEASIAIMDEIWRIMKFDGQALIVVPHGSSFGYMQDPTHQLPVNEACVTPDTEVLTECGFKPIAEVLASDSVLSLNPDTHVAEYVSDCELVTYQHDGPMVAFVGRAIDLLTTPGHRVWAGSKKTRRFSIQQADSFWDKNPKTTLFSAGVKLKYSGRDTFDIPKMPMVHGRPERNLTRFPVLPFAEFMGWYLSEGSVYVKKSQPSYYVVQIAQRKEQHRARIAEMIRELGFQPVLRPDTIVFSAFSLAQWLQQFGHCRDKYIPRALVNQPREVLLRLLNAAMAGDGSWHTNGRQIGGRYASLSRQLADDIQEVALRCGLRSSLSSKGRTMSGDAVFVVSIASSRPIMAREFRREHYTGPVHSLVMPRNKIYMARRNGKCVWTGNTFAYWDPAHPSGLWSVYRPKPWRIARMHSMPLHNIEVILEPRKKVDGSVIDITVKPPAPPRATRIRSRAPLKPARSGARRSR